MSASKKRRAEDSVEQIMVTSPTATAALMTELSDSDAMMTDSPPRQCQHSLPPPPISTSIKHQEDNDGPMSQPASAKKQKLSKKELLYQAKLRLKEAQDKKKALQERLEQQKAREEEAAAVVAAAATEARTTDTIDQDDGEDYDEYKAQYEEDYYYDYHLPPVTGATDSLLVKHIPSMGPSDKLFFIDSPDDQHDCIQTVLQVMKERKMNVAMSSSAAAAAAAGMAMGPPAVAYDNKDSSNPSKPQQLQGARENGKFQGTERQLKLVDHEKSAIESNRQTQAMQVNPTIRGNGTATNDSTNGRTQNTIRRKLPERALGDSVPSKVVHDAHPTNQENKEGLPPSVPAVRPINRSTTSNGGGESTAQPEPLKVAAGTDASRELTKGATMKKKKNDVAFATDAARSKKKIAWKRGLTQITGKALDCKIDLPSQTSYMIRTQDQSVLAQVQFLGAPNNPKLLEHNSSKKQLQDHLISVERLPSSPTKSWKGQDILDFLKRQSIQSSTGVTTYQPPARRNLPMSHWAWIELEEPLLQETPDDADDDVSTSRTKRKDAKSTSPTDTGLYFTGMLQQNSTTCQKSASSGNKPLKASDVGFAGKWVWNATEQDSSDDNSTAPSPRNSKLSKWGVVVAATPTTGTRNSAFVATIQGFYELPQLKAWERKMTSSLPIVMPQKLQARKVILTKSRTIGIIIGPAPTPENSAAGNPPAAAIANASQQPKVFGCCQVLFPNGITSGSTSLKSLLGQRAILYD